MKNRIDYLISIYNTNAKLLINSFAKVTEADSLKRPNRKTNSMIFIALHILDARCFILTQIGKPTKNPFAKYVDWAKTIDEIKTYPKLKKVLSEWNRIDGIFVQDLSRINSRKLNSSQQFEFPGGKKIINMLAFLAEHEAYHVGQISFIRKYLGYTATSYE
ncbi:MAG TPA: DinB family protein [Melioribacteraceae bacterium]|nr:DinB family protein [Melioribacteraceae bacterium]